MTEHNKPQPDEQTHFGYENVARAHKAGRVRRVFDSVTDRYDLMNDLMSAGMHRLWKRFTIAQAGVRPGHRVLDVAGGTGDLAAGIARRAGPDGSVVLFDINQAMLQRARERLVNRGIAGNLSIIRGDAEKLPFADNRFDRVLIGFGLRNVTDKPAALASMLRVLKPGGKLLILEFSKPYAALEPLYDLYSFKVLPQLGQAVAGDAASYRYLAESIRMHPDQESLLQLMRDAGFERCRYQNLSAGVVALHIGYKV